MNGGYIMIKASDADIYLEASRALIIGKPILFYENDTTCYYIDTITLDGTNVVLTKGGKTITIANDNTITSVGEMYDSIDNYQIKLDNSDYSLECHIMIKNLPYQNNTLLDINSELFEYLKNLGIFNGMIFIDTQSEKIMFVYDTDDEDNYILDLRDNDGASASGNTAISKVMFVKR